MTALVLLTWRPAGGTVHFWHHQVKPVLSRVKVTLVFLALSLAASIVLFVNIDSPREASVEEKGGRAVAGVYSDAAARSFEPEAFCGGGPDLS